MHRDNLPSYLPFLSLIAKTEVPHPFNPLNAELNPICHLLALLGAHHILHVSRIKVNCVFIDPVCLF